MQQKGSVIHSYSIKEAASQNSSLLEASHELLQRENELWSKTSQSPNADSLFLYRQVSLELYELQTTWLQVKILEKHKKHILVRSNAQFARLNEEIGDYAKLVLEARDAYRAAKAALKDASTLSNGTTNSPLSEQEAMLAADVRACQKRLTAYHAELVKYLCEFRNVSRVARVELVETLSFHLAADSLEAPPPTIEKSGKTQNKASLGKRVSTFFKRSSVNFANVNFSLSRRGSLVSTNSLENEQENGSKRDSMRSYASASKRESTISASSSTLSRDKSNSDYLRPADQSRNVSYGMPVVVDEANLLHPAIDVLQRASSPLITDVNRTFLVREVEYRQFIHEHQNLLKRVEELEKLTGNFDDCQPWEEDCWRLENLKKFKKDLEYVNSCLSKGHEDKKFIEYQKHQKVKLEARIAALGGSAASKNLEYDTSLPFAYQSQQELEIHTVIKDYQPIKKDELELREGDQVTISMVSLSDLYQTFTDGLAHGHNKTTGELGMFPLSYLNVRDSFPAKESDDESITIPPVGQKLLFTMIPPNRALEIIHGMPASRRVQYFEQIGGIDSLSEVSSLAPEEPVKTKASKMWSKLREGWRDAVEAELAKGFEQWERSRSRNRFWSIIVENYKVPQKLVFDERDEVEERNVE